MNELYRQHELLTVPFMTGINNHEGGFLLGDVSAESRSHLFSVEHRGNYNFLLKSYVFCLLLGLFFFCRPLHLQTGLKEWTKSQF